jgi:hypothetical protein
VEYDNLILSRYLTLFHMGGGARYSQLSSPQFTERAVVPSLVELYDEATTAPAIATRYFRNGARHQVLR